MNSALAYPLPSHIGNDQYAEGGRPTSCRTSSEVAADLAGRLEMGRDLPAGQLW